MLSQMLIGEFLFFSLICVNLHFAQAYIWAGQGSGGMGEGQILFIAYIVLHRTREGKICTFWSISLDCNTSVEDLATPMAPLIVCRILLRQISCRVRSTLMSHWSHVPLWPCSHFLDFGTWSRNASDRIYTSRQREAGCQHKLYSGKKCKNPFSPIHL